MKNFWKIAVVLFVSLAATGCVTTKKKGSQKVGWFKKGYHNMTSHYNYWFNANELMNTSVAKLNEAHKDNYNQILDIYPYMATDPQPTKGDMDNVITKTAKAISIHRVSDWTDDNYLLFAQAQHLKKDFETAETSFQFIKEELDPHKKLPKTKLKKGKKKEDTKKKKSKKKKKKKVSAKKKKAAKAKAAKEKAAKEKAAAEAAKQPVKPKTEEPVAPLGNDPYSAGGFKRRSAWPDAMIWYGRTLIEREKYEEAEYHFQQLAEDPFFPNALRDDLATAEAYNWMKQKRYDRAIPPLSRAIQLTTKKKQRARLAYILAQLYDRAGRHEEAYAAFDKVLGSRPTFEMEFNARLQQIESGWENGKITAKDADKTLNRMAAEAKNADYRDQIHFTLASIALKENEKTAAIAYLRQSLASNKGNASQRAESYLKLAELYFEAEDFVLAKNYYDSTLTVLAATDERYKQVDLFAKNLTDIARLITTIAANDSIVRVYNMSDGERKDLAKKLKKQREEETALADAEAAKKEKEKPAPGSAPKSGPVAGAKASSFYFYNEAFVKKGKKDFQKTWGDRKLEDNWRRSSRRPNQDGNDELAAADSTKTDGVSDAELDDIFQSLPKSTEELAVIHLATYDAMYQLGVLYRDKLQNNRRSTGTLEDMQARYPDTTKHEKEAWYYCFVGFTDLENPPKAKEYYDKLVAKYPNSSYARAISDPNFINAQKQREKEVNDYYETAYGDFKKGQYKPAFDKCEDAPRKFGSQNPMMPKFALLSALCIGNLQGKDAYCGALSDVIGRFPQSNEATRAKEIARYVGKAKNLRNRLNVLFWRQKIPTRQNQGAGAHADHIEFTIVETEHDALLLENTLIKKHQPRYNVMLKDEKSPLIYICIKARAVPQGVPHPQNVRDGSTYFGPYLQKFGWNRSAN
jgi:tetratricopeptide (TPR) repeat protein